MRSHAAQAPDPDVERGPANGLLIGDPHGLRAEDLDGFLRLRRGSIGDAVRALSAGAVDLILVDGMLPAEELRRVLDGDWSWEDGERPVVVVITEEGRRTNVDSRLIERVDDFVNGARGLEVLQARVRRALRLRECMRELSRKNAQLEALSGRLEGLLGRMADELRLAGNVQRSLLPSSFVHPRLEIAREFIPFREIGGDYYDLVSLGDDRVGFAIGDVMGKGVPAALLAANLKACLRAQLQGGTANPEDLVARVNRLFWEVTPRGLFASLVFVIVDMEDGRLRYVNAGHDYPLLVRNDGSVQELDSGGTVLGLVENSRYRVGDVAFHKGDTLVLYSDGVTDRTDRSGEPFGADRLREVVVRSRRDPARIALYSLLGEVQGWSDGGPPEDDMTLVVARSL
jgi:serine phosphatase RsbU (regulator of sigma subunit)